MRNKNFKMRVINYLTIVFKLFPRVVMDFFWSIFDSSENRLAVTFRLIYLKKYAKRINGFVYIGKSTNLKNIHNLSIGDEVSIHSYTYIDAFGGITIGDNVSIANHCTLISSDHTWENEELPIKFNQLKKKPIKIFSDVWIASGCRILGDVVINQRTIVGAGAVVNKNLEGYSLYVGVPVKKIKDLG